MEEGGDYFMERQSLIGKYEVDTYEEHTRNDSLIYENNLFRKIEITEEEIIQERFIPWRDTVTAEWLYEPSPERRVYLLRGQRPTVSVIEYEILEQTETTMTWRYDTEYISNSVKFRYRGTWNLTRE